MKLRVKTHGLLNVLLSNILAEVDLAGEGKRAIEEMQQIAEERGGKCLSISMRIIEQGFCGNVPKGISGKRHQMLSSEEAGARNVAENMAKKNS